MSEIIYGSIDTGDLVIKTSELCHRLGSPESCIAGVVHSCADKLAAVCRPRYCFVKTSVSVNGDNTELGFLNINSHSLAIRLKGTQEAFILALTLGIEADRYIASVSALSHAEAFVADAVASAMCESAADYVCAVISDKVRLRERFSPGYGDLTLGFQKPVLEYLNADRLLGIKLGENLIMTPRKSITAICGVEGECYEKDT